MNDIPDEIMQRARHIAFPHDDDLVLVLGIARAIMEAEERGEAREREECAKVAEEYTAGGCACEGCGCTCGNYDDAGSAGGASSAKYIVAAIRKRGEATHYPVIPPPLEPGSFTREELKEAVQKVSKRGEA